MEKTRRNKDGLIIFYLIIACMVISQISYTSKFLNTIIFGDEIKANIARYESRIESTGKGGSTTYYIPIINLKNDFSDIDIPIMQAKHKRKVFHLGEEVIIKSKNTNLQTIDDFNNFADNSVINNNFYIAHSIQKVFSSLSFSSIGLIIFFIFNKIGSPYKLKDRFLVLLYSAPIFINALIGIYLLYYLKARSILIYNPAQDILGIALFISLFFYALIKFLETLLTRKK